jgi:hypothetical protein
MKLKNSNKIITSIIKTLVYADIFDFPMKKSEVWRYLIGPNRIAKSKLYKHIDRAINEGLIGVRNSYLFLRGRNKLVDIRKEREKESLIKNEIAIKAIRILKLIPTVNLIGISGSLSMQNSKIMDDIDLFIISKANTLWFTRFLVNLLLIVAGFKRGRNDSFGVNLICPNMFMSENRLLIPKAKQSIFSAHEVVQMKVVFDREDTHDHFLHSNSWVLDFLPNSVKVFYKNKESKNSNPILSLLNYVFFTGQFLYMQKRITNEEIRIDVARFHPKDRTDYVETLFRLRFEKYISLTNYRLKNALREKSTPAPVTTGY